MPNQADDDDPVPHYFSWRYIFWITWTNAITLLGLAQSICLSIIAMEQNPTTKEAILPWSVMRIVLLANAMLIPIVAQFKKNNPPGPPPIKPSSRS